MNRFKFKFLRMHINKTNKCCFLIHNKLVPTFMDEYFNPFLAAFRKGFGCQSTLLRLLEDWRKALNNHECVVAILMDLSKAFDCLPHGLLITKSL